MHAGVMRPWVNRKRYDRSDCSGRPRPGAPRAGIHMANIDELKSTGLKATLPRLKILDVFQKGAQRHMTAEDVFRVLLRRALRHRPGHRLPRADAVRAGRHPDAQPLRKRQGRLRAQRGHAPRPPGVPGLRPGRGVLRRRRSRSGSTPWPRPRASLIAEHALEPVRALHQGRLPEPAERAARPPARIALTCPVPSRGGAARRIPGRCRRRAAAGWCCARRLPPARRCCGRPPPGSRPCAPARPARPA